MSNLSSSEHRLDLVATALVAVAASEKLDQCPKERAHTGAAMHWHWDEQL